MNSGLLSNLKTSDISRYRQTLMGVAIFGVMFSHWFGFQSIKSGIPFELSAIVVRLVFTEGFLFLSGFGLYYSFSKNHDIKSFYKRRFIRLYIPFVLLSLPLYSYFLIAREGYGFVDFFSQLTTVYFWFKGNYGGMWYVSLSLMLYLLFPLLYKFLFSKNSTGSICIRGLCFFIIFYFIIIAIKSLYGDYYGLIKIGIEKIPFFIIGMLFANVVKNEKMTQQMYWLCFIIMTLIYLVLTFTNHFTPGYWVQHSAGIFQKLFFIPLVCFIFNYLVKVKVGRIIVSFFNWLGRLSLELYILHLHFYMFFHHGFLNTSLSPLCQASLAVVLALLLCQPVNGLITKVTGKVN